ncbi:unnamed protein product [Amoebophrya sp. A120]|nr:unnamed protein product [Amoebophrya sp. A120]|eukprot:GSA120T00003238001.1
MAALSVEEDGERAQPKLGRMGCLLPLSVFLNVVQFYMMLQLSARFRLSSPGVQQGQGENGISRPALLAQPPSSSILPIIRYMQGQNNADTSEKTPHSREVRQASTTPAATADEKPSHDADSHNEVDQSLNDRRKVFRFPLQPMVVLGEKTATSASGEPAKPVVGKIMKLESFFGFRDEHEQVRQNNGASSHAFSALLSQNRQPKPQVDECAAPGRSCKLPILVSDWESFYTAGRLMSGYESLVPLGDGQTPVGRKQKFQAIPWIATYFEKEAFKFEAMWNHFAETGCFEDTTTPGTTPAAPADGQQEPPVSPSEKTAVLTKMYGHWYGLDKIFLYCFLKTVHQPGLFLEVGSGHSTEVARLALREAAEKSGKKTQHIAIEPYRTDQVPASVDVIVSEVQDLDPNMIVANLHAGDVFFIDSSHITKAYGDTLYELLTILPQLRPGVIVHVHDVFLPDDYPVEHAANVRWTEQWLLALLLYGNVNGAGKDNNGGKTNLDHEEAREDLSARWEILWGSHYAWTRFGRSVPSFSGDPWLSKVKNNPQQAMPAGWFKMQASLWLRKLV